MNKWQKIWLIVVISFSLIHILRDVLQDFGVNNFLTTILASPGPPKVAFPLYWTIFNTYLIAGLGILFSVICLKRDSFGKLGLSTVAVAIISLFLWVFYYFVL